MTNSRTTLLIHAANRPRRRAAAHLARSRARGACLLVLLGALGLPALPACSGRASVAPHGDPGDRGHANGLETTWWAVEEFPAAMSGHRSLVAVLKPYAARPVPADPQTLALWRANGLRVVAVPRADLDEVREQLAITGPVAEQWHGQIPQWTGLMKSPRWGGPRTLMLDNGRLSLPDGSLRLLVRCWTVPVEPSHTEASVMDAALQLELVPQHVEPRPNTIDFEQALRGPLTPRLATDEGLVLSRLTLRLLAGGDDAYLVIPEDPAADWGAERSPDQGDPTSPDDAPRAAPPEFLPVGPAIPVIPTLGAAMLGETTHGGRERRVVIVLTPRVPVGFGLLRQ